MRHFHRFLLLILALVLSPLGERAAALDLVIDDFRGRVHIEAIPKKFANPARTELRWGAESNIGPLQGYRGYIATVTSGEKISVETKSVGQASAYIHKAMPDTKGTSQIIWDGPAGPTRLSPKGLQGLDLK